MFDFHPTKFSSMFTVYVLYSVTHSKIYIGFSSDIEKRLFAHNHPGNKGWTKSFQPWTLIYTEVFETKSGAMQREKQLKSSKGRSFIKDLIHSH
jgi:putative endonuclease